MNLGELEFKAEDFVDKNNPTRKLLSEDESALAEAMAEFSAEQANRILREKLANAPEVEAFISHHKLELWAKYQNLNGHKRARLVCIEEVGK